MKSYYAIMGASRGKHCTNRRPQWSQIQWVKKGEGREVALNSGGPEAAVSGGQGRSNSQAVTGTC